MKTPNNFTQSKRLMSHNFTDKISRWTVGRLNTIYLVLSKFSCNLLARDHRLIFSSSSSIDISHISGTNNTVSSAYLHNEPLNQLYKLRMYLDQ